ncbi:STAS domain-containing protein [Herminiimonas sp. NPDC097707]|uniref:STAS domain-containing protein n=1 Tax=Herminiimonas sp. NPDC097707 TaxID=3364007 RepID=UPI00383BE714
MPLFTRIDVGIFSLFGKKSQQPARKSTEQESTQKKRSDNAARINAKNENEQTQQVQRKAAHATAMKIDAIESEMSSEFVKPLPFSGNTLPGPSSQFMNTNVRGPDTRIHTKPVSDTTPPPLEQPSMLPDIMGASTAFLLGAETVIGPVAISASEAAPVIEEAAILFANGQTDLVEPILLNAIAEDALGSTPLTVWGMLFDLYQITGQRTLFENLSIEYANKFEMSPPAWVDGNSAETQAQPAAPRASTTPSVAFSGKLDAGSIKQLERIKNMAEMSNVIKLEFARVSEVDPVGCGLLFSILQRLQKSGHNLILVGAPELAEKIRSILQVGRRDETEAPWLLLLEILRLLNRESDFEETSIDYCVTFEVSPPAFVSPQNKVATAAEESAEPDDAPSDHFMMPVVIDARTDTLEQNIAVHAHTHNPVILDCSRLTRMDFNAAGRLFGSLTPLINSGKSIELRHANHFIVALCHVMGVAELVRIVPRKN